MSLSRKSISLFLLILAFWLLPVISTQADTVAEEWIIKYDGPGHLDDVANAMVLDTSGNIYVTGESTGHESVSFDAMEPAAQLFTRFGVCAFRKPVHCYAPCTKDPSAATGHGCQ